MKRKKKEEVTNVRGLRVIDKNYKTSVHTAYGVSSRRLLSEHVTYQPLRMVFVTYLNWAVRSAGSNFWIKMGSAQIIRIVQLLHNGTFLFIIFVGFSKPNI